MSSFTEPLILTPAGMKHGKPVWKTARAFAYEIGLKGSGLLIRVPAGTETDLMTIPRLLWPLLPPHDPRYAAAFVLHDHLCRWSGFNRIITDAVLYEALRVLGAGPVRASLVYFGARLWGALTA